MSMLDGPKRWTATWPTWNGWRGATTTPLKLDAEEIGLLGATRTGIAHCPQSNGRLGSGIAPVRALEDAGAVVSIGVDDAASNEAADMISETHAAWLMQRARGGEAALARHRGGTHEGGAHAASVEDVVRWGTQDGAAVLGLHDVGIAPVASGGRPTLRLLTVAGRTPVDADAVPGLDLAALAHDARAAVRSMLA